MKPIITLVACLFTLTVFGQGQLQKEAAGNFHYASGHILQLAEAIPENKFNWAPQEGVRTTAQVLAHIISANYYFGSKMGATIPAGVNMETLEKDLKTKAAIIAALKQSTDFALAAIQNTKDDALSKKVEFPFPGEYTTMSSILIVMGHANEHLGQLIAYARSNGIKPPWSE